MAPKGLEITLHLTNIGVFAVQELLAKGLDLVILLVVLMQIL